MIRKFIEHEEFYKIFHKHEYFIWNFVSKNHSPMLQIRPIFHEIKKEEVEIENYLTEILKYIDIPYYESYIEDSVDFLINLKLPPNLIWLNELHIYNPVLIGFKGPVKKFSTYEGFCYCNEGILDLVYNLNPDFLLNIKID